jgi:hypothetical protein
MVSPKLLVHFLTVVLKDLGKQLKGSLVELMKQSYGRKTRFWMRKQDFEKREACTGDIAI